jgi:8-oxo-dGTP pyrophosphatase MutT (NUDIX family)
MYNHNDELVDIVNEHDEVITTAWRSQSKGRRYMRCAIAFIINAENKLCILRRTKDKESLPLHGAIVGGGVQSGESYEQGMRREAMEETNLDMYAYPWRQLGKITPHDYPGHFFKMVYEIRVDDINIACNPADFDIYWWLQPHEIVHENPLCLFAPDLPWLVAHFYPQLLKKLCKTV